MMYILCFHYYWLVLLCTMCMRSVYKAIHGLAPCYLNEMCIPVSTVPNLSVLRSAARGDLVVYSEQGYSSATGHFLCGWLGHVEQSTTGNSFGTYIINVQKHAQDMCSLVPTSLTN